MVASLSSPDYLIAYLMAVASIFTLITSLLLHVKKKRVQVKGESLLALLREELSRLFKGDAVFIMHGSIIGGVVITIALTLIDPFDSTLYAIRDVLLVLSLPVIMGLLVALVWRILRLRSSLGVHRMLDSEKGFQRKSVMLQSVMMFAILLTLTQATLEWLSGFGLVATTLDAVKNVVISVFYTGPAVNLYMNFQRPKSDVTVPFLLKDVIEGRVDPSQVRMGVSTIDQFQDYERSSIESCVEIGACEAACPATAVGRPLSPRVLVRKLRLLENQKGTDSCVFPTINEEELWACTTCAACIESCPVGVRHVDMILDMRRTLVSENRLDKKKSDLLGNLHQVRNSLGIPNSGRNDWLRKLGVKTVNENPNFEYLLWVGCMSSFDEGSKASIKALVEILGCFGVLESVAILGDAELCCGDPARRLGEESLFQEFALGNIELFKKYGVRKIVLTCPHGCNTFSKDYPKLDAWMQGIIVYHQVQLIEELVAEKRLSIRGSEEEFTIHDPCYLSRYGDVVDQQRRLIKMLGKVVETHPHGEKTFCCGAGGANYWYEVQERKRISHQRMEQLAESGAKTVVTLCPFCNAMLKDASRTKGMGEGWVKDLSEVIRDSIKDQSGQSR